MSEFREALQDLFDAVDSITLVPVQWNKVRAAYLSAKALLARGEQSFQQAVDPAAAEKAREWQPIETAPKDGTRVLLYCLPNEVPTLPQHIAAGYWQATTGILKPGTWRFLVSVGPSYKPTYWAELPSPPAATGETK